MSTPIAVTAPTASPRWFHQTMRRAMEISDIAFAPKVAAATAGDLTGGEMLGLSYEVGIKGQIATIAANVQQSLISSNKEILSQMGR